MVDKRIDEPKPIALDEAVIQNKIYEVRGQKVMLDRDLA
ncbi:MAG: hypothetical protein BWX66_01765 [Deltaproteobacteria bacterium ADurb.Bin058]|nr:MAG: hypothetical protein BWX66_01765 [Deltaproteobacteria bacterium ADurb.Bin058]